MKKKRLFIIIGFVLVLILIVILNLKYQEPGIRVDTIVVDFDSIESKVSGDGELKAQAQVNLQAQTMGTVEKLLVKEGDKVKRGQIVCLLDSKSVKADFNLAQAQFNQAQLILMRSESLYAQKLISPQEYESYKTNFQVTKARLEQMQDRLEKTMITTPISGTVTQLNIEEGETVVIGTMNNLGTILMVIADLSRMMGIITVDETEVRDIKPGAATKVTIDAFPDTIFYGVVSKVGYMPKQTVTSSIEKSTDFEIEIEMTQANLNLRPGMTINAEIITAQKDSVLVVPIQAIGRRKVKGKETQSLFIVEKGIAKLTPIKTGINSETSIEIIDGVKPGDIIITGPYKVLSKLKDGDRVKNKE